MLSLDCSYKQNLFTHMKEAELFKSPQILAGGEILSLFSIIEVKLAFTKNDDLLFAL